MNNHFNRELLDRRTFIKGFIKEITVRGNDRRIKYALPLPPDNIKEENLKDAYCTVQWAVVDLNH